MFCKTIILSNSQNINSNAPKGILTLSNQNNTTIGKIRLYNILSLPQNAKIGLYINEQVYISALNKRPQHYEFDLDKNINLNNNIYCAIIDNSRGDKQVILEGGSFNGFYFTDSPFDAVLESKDEELEQTIDKAMKEVDSCPCDKNCGDCEYKKYFYDNYDNSSIHINNIYDATLTKDFNIPEDQIQLKEVESPPDNKSNMDSASNNMKDGDENKQSLNSENNIGTDENHIIKNIDEENLNNTQYIDETDDKFSENEDLSYKEDTNNSYQINDISYLKKDDTHDSKKSVNNEEAKSPNIQLDEEENQFLNDIIYQLDEMFVKYPADDVLNSIIPDSRFIKVETDLSKPYVLGVIYENKMMKYISYGVPAKYNSLPPVDLGQNYQWLPLNPEDVMSDGYYLIYQNALTGKIVDLTIE